MGRFIDYFCEMQYYFTLQYRRFLRRMFELGLSPLLAMVLGIVLFILGSAYLFHKTSYASLIYPILALSALLSLGERSRVHQLQTIFPRALYHKVRMIENVLCVLPFSAYLMSESEWLISGLLLVTAPITAMMTARWRLPFTIPTPFSQLPFEYIVGFRRYWLLMIIDLFVLYKAIEVSNYFLGLFTVGVMSFMAIAFYSALEREYFVWIYSDTPHDFLFRKMKTAIVCNVMLVAPVLLSMVVVFPDRYLLTLGAFALGTVYVCSMILAKYATYPHEMSLPQSMIYGLSFAFPPLLLILIPRFYLLSKNRLSGILS